MKPGNGEKPKSMLMMFLRRGYLGRLVYQIVGAATVLDLIAYSKPNPFVSSIFRHALDAGDRCPIFFKNSSCDLGKLPKSFFFVVLGRLRARGWWAGSLRIDRFQHQSPNDLVAAPHQGLMQLVGLRNITLTVRFNFLHFPAA